MKLTPEVPQMSRPRFTTTFGALGLATGIFLLIPVAQFTTQMRKINADSVTSGATYAPPEAPPIVENPITTAEPPPLPPMPVEPTRVTIDDVAGVGIGIGVPGYIGPDITIPTVANFQDIFEVGDVDHIPEVIEQIAPRIRNMPREAVTVTVEFIVDERGNVTNLQLIKSAGDAIDKPVLDAVARWRFSPGMIDNQPVRTRIRQEFAIGR